MLREFCSPHFGTCQPRILYAEGKRIFIVYLCGLLWKDIISGRFKMTIVESGILGSWKLVRSWWYEDLSLYTWEFYWGSVRGIKSVIRSFFIFLTFFTPILCFLYPNSVHTFMLLTIFFTFFTLFTSISEGIVYGFIVDGWTHRNVDKICD